MLNYTEPPKALSPSQQAVFDLILELRNALAAAMRVIAENDNVDRFITEARQAGVKDGIGVRADDWLKKHRAKK